MNKGEMAAGKYSLHGACGNCVFLDKPYQQLGGGFRYFFNFHAYLWDRLDIPDQSHEGGLEDARSLETSRTGWRRYRGQNREGTSIRCKGFLETGDGT